MSYCIRANPKTEQRHIDPTAIHDSAVATLFSPLKLRPSTPSVPYPNGNKGTVTDS